MTASNRPTPTSTILAILAGLAIIGLFLRELAGLTVPITMGITGVLCLTVCLFFASTATSPIEGFLLGVLTIPVGVGFVGGLFGSALILISAQFPVESSADISLALLHILGGLSILVGCTLAVFGLSVGYRNVLTEVTLDRYFKTALVTASVPVVVGVVLFIQTAIRGGHSRATESIFGELVSQGFAALLSPTPPHLHLASFLFVLTVTGIAVLAFIQRAPLGDLLAERGVTGADRILGTAHRVVQFVTVGIAVALGIAILIEVTTAPRELEQLLGSGTYDLIQLGTTAGWLRTLLIGVTALLSGWVAVTLLLEQWLNWSDPGKAEWLSPLAAGGLLTVVAWFSAGRILDRTLTETTTRLPPSLAAELQDGVLPVIRVYGETAIVILAAGILVVLAGWIGLTCWLAVHFGYLSDDGAGFSIASAGLLFATVAMTTQGPPTGTILLGVVAALVVWDLGQFGTELGRTVGRTDTRQLELLHAAATVGIGLTGVALALFVESRVTQPFDVSPTVTLAVVCLGVGLVAFSLALRDSVPFR